METICLSCQRRCNQLPRTAASIILALDVNPEMSSPNREYSFSMIRLPTFLMAREITGSYCAHFFSRLSELRPKTRQGVCMVSVHGSLPICLLKAPIDSLSHPISHSVLRTRKLSILTLVSSGFPPPTLAVLQACKNGNSAVQQWRPKLHQNTAVQRNPFTLRHGDVPKQSARTAIKRRYFQAYSKRDYRSHSRF